MQASGGRFESDRLHHFSRATTVTEPRYKIRVPVENLEPEFLLLKPFEAAAKLANWCGEQFGEEPVTGTESTGGTYTALLFIFTNHVQAVHFKLRWNGGEPLFDETKCRPLTGL